MENNITKQNLKKINKKQEQQKYQQTKLELDRVCCRFHVSHNNDLLFLCSAPFKWNERKTRSMYKIKYKKIHKKKQQTFYTQFTYK